MSIQGMAHEAFHLGRSTIQQPSSLPHPPPLFPPAVAIVCCIKVVLQDLVGAVVGGWVGPVVHAPQAVHGQGPDCGAGGEVWAGGRVWAGQRGCPFPTHSLAPGPLPASLWISASSEPAHQAPPTCQGSAPQRCWSGWENTWGRDRRGTGSAGQFSCTGCACRLPCGAPIPANPPAVCLSFTRHPAPPPTLSPGHVLGNAVLHGVGPHPVAHAAAQRGVRLLQQGAVVLETSFVQHLRWRS